MKFRSAVSTCRNVYEGPEATGDSGLRRGGLHNDAGDAGRGNAEFYYDSLKRLTRAVNVETGPICYGTSQSGNNCVGGYDGCCGSAGCSFVYSWNLAGSLKTYLLPSGRLVRYAPDAAGRVGGSDRPDGGLGVLGNAASVAGLGISYCAGAATADCSNNNGSPQLMTVSPVGVTQSFSYDTLDRLGTASEMPTAGGAAVWSQAYGYDRYGNRWVTSTGLGSNGLEPASQSWYTAATNQFADTTNYDAAGNRTWMSPYTLAYDAENRLASATSPSNGSTTYAYDGDGNRVLALFSNGTYTLYVNDAQGELGAEYSTAAPGGSGTQYVSVDQLGSTRVTTDGSGNVTGRYDYLPFGLELGPLGLANRTAALGYRTAGPRLKFTGKAFDSETGLDYFGARYFSSAQGRFTSPDGPFNDQVSSDPQSWNLYSYVRNNPLKYTDPTGQDCFYTSGQTDQSVTVSVETGSCSQKGGTYINGTIDLNSLSYNGKSLDVDYQDYSGAAGVLSKNFGPAVYEFPGIEGPANRAGAAQIAGDSTAGINAFLKQAAFGAAAGLAGRFIGIGIEAALAGRAAAAETTGAVQFGKTANQIYHAFRHLQEEGVNIEQAKDAILSDIASKGTLPQGLTKGAVNVGGRTLNYNAYKLADGTINVGSITAK